MKSKFNQAKLSQSPLFTDMEANDECDFIKFYKDCDLDGEHFNFLHRSRDQTSNLQVEGS